MRELTESEREAMLKAQDENWQELLGKNIRWAFDVGFVAGLDHNGELETTKELLRAVEEFRQAFVIAVGDKSPFAKEALRRLDFAVAIVSAQLTPGEEAK